MAAKPTRREIDKEQMYKKLMPTSLRLPKEGQEEAESAFQPQEVSAAMPHRHVARREIPVPMMSAQSLSLVNAMETIVLQKLDSAMSRMKCCKCDRCKKDIVAIALNKLPPKYRVMEGRDTLADVDAKINAQVVTAIIQAILIVRNNPRH